MEQSFEFFFFCVSQTAGMYHIGTKTSTGIPLFCTVSNSDDSGFLGWLTHWRLLLSQVQCVLDLLANKSCMLLLIVNQMQTGDHHPDVFWRLLSRQKYQFICSILERDMSQATRLLLYGAKKKYASLMMKILVWDISTLQVSDGVLWGRRKPNRMHLVGQESAIEISYIRSSITELSF